MRVVVKFHESAQTDYDAWITRLSQPPTGNAVIAQIHVEELIRQLQKSLGVPTGAVYRKEFDPPCWVWRFSTDAWISFIHKRRRTGGWGGVILEVVITGLSNQPPA